PLICTPSRVVAWPAAARSGAAAAGAARARPVSRVAVARPHWAGEACLRLVMWLMGGPLQEERGISAAGGSRHGAARGHRVGSGRDIWGVMAARRVERAHGGGVRRPEGP